MNNINVIEQISTWGFWFWRLTFQYNGNGPRLSTVSYSFSRRNLDSVCNLFHRKRMPLLLFVISGLPSKYSSKFGILNLSCYENGICNYVDMWRAILCRQTWYHNYIMGCIYLLLIYPGLRISVPIQHMTKLLFVWDPPTVTYY